MTSEKIKEIKAKMFMERDGLLIYSPYWDKDKHKLIEALEVALATIEFYKGDFDGKEGSRWNVDMFFIETKFGSTISAAGNLRARQALEIIEGIFNMSPKTTDQKNMLPKGEYDDRCD